MRKFISVVILLLGPMPIASRAHAGLENGCLRLVDLEYEGNRTLDRVRDAVSGRPHAKDSILWLKRNTAGYAAVISMAGDNDHRHLYVVIGENDGAILSAHVVDIVFDAVAKTSERRDRLQGQPLDNLQFRLVETASPHNAGGNVYKLTFGIRNLAGLDWSSCKAVSK